MTTTHSTTRQSATTKAPVNGVDVQKVLDTVQALQRQPDLGAFQFRADNRWDNGARNESRIQSFYGAGQEDTTRTQPYTMANDEPPVLAGNDTAPNPVEWLLHALAGCMTTTTVMHAATRGIEIEKMESHFEGDIDVRGFLGIAPQVSKGYRKITATFTVKSEADARKLEELMKMSPVYNTITNPTPIEIRIVKE